MLAMYICGVYLVHGYQVVPAYFVVGQKIIPVVTASAPGNQVAPFTQAVIMNVCNFAVIIILLQLKPNSHSSLPVSSLLHLN